ncbi:MAG: prolyl oligopeptidase family serine peptidase [Candidatus Kapaibacteriales bacterium]
MKKVLLLVAVAAIMVGCEEKSDPEPAIAFNPPETKTVDHKDTLHGNVLDDPYRWLENKENPEVRAWSEAQSEYAHRYIDSMGPEIEGLKDELVAFYDRRQVSAPTFKGEKEFISIKEIGDKHSTLYTISNGDTLKIFSPTDVDTSGQTSWFDVAYNKDGSIVAVATQYKGNEIATYRFFNTETQEEIYKPIDDLRSLRFSEDMKLAYVTRRSQKMIDEQTPLPTYLHTLGTDPSNDKFLISAPSAVEFADVFDDTDGKYTFYTYGDFYSNTLKVKKLGRSGSGKKIYASKDFRAAPLYHNGKMYFFTNHEAPNFKVMVADENKPEFEHWEDFIPESEDKVIKSLEFVGDSVFVVYKQDVLSRLALYDIEGNFVNELKLPEVADIGGISYNTERNKIFVSANTFTDPPKIYELDPSTLQFSLFYKEEMPYDNSNVVVEMKKYKSKDGTMVPIFIMHNKDVVREGQNPTLLYGYGGFNISLSPSFGLVKDMSSFLARGGVFAIANLRGGSEYGENWHLQGMKEKKQNVFDDFIAAADYLVSEGYTNPEQLAISGRSNGGLLTGTVVTQAPDKFKAAVVGVPLLDMIRYHKFLIAQYWIPEYGSADNKEDYEWLIKYSPYHNIDPEVNYPNVYVHTGEYDTRVDPLHAKKYAARMQAGKNQTNPILLDVDFEGGHGSGGSGKSVEKLVETRYRELKFIMNSIGMK